MSDRLVRPYLLTGGRTKVEGVELALEAMLTTTETGVASIAGRPSEEARLLATCRQPTALVELSAALKLPLGVVRVLAGDLVREGYLVQGATTTGSEVPLLERLLEGLKADS